MDVGSSNSKTLVVIPPPFRGLHVLLVDPDRKSLSYIASLLEEQSYQVTATERAMVALSMIHEKEGRRYDLILADVNMEEVDCFRFIKEIASHNLPTIVMASGEHMDIVEKVINEYAVYFLRKPCRAKDVLNVWQHAVPRKRRIHIEKKTMIEDYSIKQNSNEIFKPADTAISETSELFYQRGDGDKNGRGTRSFNGKPMEEEEKKTKKKRGITSRITWTPALHLRFKEALNELGLKTHPKALQRKMDVPFLTHRHIASHLQKYRARIKYQCDNSTSARSLMAKSIFDGSRGHGSTPQPQECHPAKFSPAVAVTMPCLNSRDGAYSTLGTLKVAEKVPTKYIPTTNNHDQVRGLINGKGKLPLHSDFQNWLNSTTNFGMLDGLENSDQFLMAFPGQREEINFTRDFRDGASKEMEAMKVAMGSSNRERESLPDIDMIMTILEGEDFENFGDLKGDDIDRFSQWLWAPSDFD